MLAGEAVANTVGADALRHDIEISKPQPLTPNAVFLTWALVALCGRAILTVMAALKLAGVDPFGTTIPYSVLNNFADALGEVGILSGLLAGGVAIGGAVRGSAKTDSRMLRWAGHLWSIVNVAALLAGVLGLLESRAGFALPPLLDVVLLLVLALIVVSLRRRDSAPLADVWVAGIAVVGVGTALSLIAPADYGTDRLLHAVALNLRNIGWMVAGIGVAFWLIGRFSRVEAWWARMGVYTCGGLMAVAGVGAGWPGLEMALLTNGVILPPLAGVLAACALILPALLICAHLYRAVSDPIENDLLIAHWVSLFALALLIGAGLHAANAWPGVQVYTAGTRLADVGASLWQFALLALTPGVLNQRVADERGTRTRVAGLSAFWLIGFGNFAGALLLAGVGLVQVYMQRLSSIGFQESEAMLMPIYGLWAAANGAILIGLLWIALSYAIRCPKRIPAAFAAPDEATAPQHAPRHAPEHATNPAS